jgi:hypothetical protein
MENNNYPHQDKEAVQKYWPEGKHPEQCIGECMIINAGGIDMCHRCHWDEYDLYVVNSNRRNFLKYLGFKSD